MAPRIIPAMLLALDIGNTNVTVGLLRRSGGNVGMVGFAMSEDNIDRILAHPCGMVCSDGGGFAIGGRAG